MVETDIGLHGSENGIFVTEKKPLANENVALLFGSNYRELIEKKAEQLGIKEKLYFFDKPKPHEGSQAVYLVEQFIGDHLVLVPALEPGMETSRHHHASPMLKEMYFHIAGKSTVDIGEGEKLKSYNLNEQNGLVEVSLDTVHQVKTSEAPSLTLIVMQNARLVPPGQLHIRHIK